MKSVLDNKLSFTTKLGYGIGQGGDSAGYNLYYTYFLFFLTDVAMVSPAFAGVISLIAITWDAVTDPFVGYISDNTKSKYGRRRPFMIGSAFPYSIAIVLIFSTFDISEGAKNIYYLVMAIVLWSCYKCYVIPYCSLGAEITQDFDERNTLRSYSSIFMAIAVLLASAAPPLIEDFVVARGGTSELGWAVVGLIFGVYVLISILLCWRSTRGRELKIDWQSENKKPKEKILKTYLETLKIKPYRYLLIAIFAYLLGFSIVLGSLVYLMEYNLGLDAEQQSVFWALYAGLIIPFTPIVNWMANKFDKRTVFIFGISLMSIVSIFFGVIGFSGFNSLIIFDVFFSFGNTVFWTLIYSMMYDITEVDEFISGKRREGAIAAFASFFQKLGSAAALWFTGTILSVSGYVATNEVQTEQALTAIHSCCTYIAGILTLISVVMIILYPMNKDRFKCLSNALELKRKGEEYSTEGFEKLIK